MSARIPHDHAIGRVWRLVGYARQRQRLGVCPVGVAVVSFEKNWTVGEELVEILLIRQCNRAEHRIVPAPSNDPIGAGMLSRVVPQPLLDVGNVLGSLEIDSSKAERPVEEMNVAINKAGEHQASSGIYNLCSG